MNIIEKYKKHAGVISVATLVVLMVAGGVLTKFGKVPAAVHASSTPGQIDLYAGGDTLNGDGGQAVDALLKEATGIAVDSHNNTYIAEAGTDTIRKVDTNGVITTVIGTKDVSGFSGDGGAASSATLDLGFSHNLYYSFLTFDASNNLYIADSNNNRIRKVTPGADGVISGDSDEIITTVAGGGTACVSTDACGDGGPATSATLNKPTHVIFDSAGAMYISDSGNNKIRKVVGGVISTVAGTGSIGSPNDGNGGSALLANVSAPLGMAFNADGELVFWDSNTHFDSSLRKIDASGVITSILYQTGHYVTGHTVLYDQNNNWVWNQNDLGQSVGGQLSLLVSRNDGGYRVRQATFDQQGNILFIGQYYGPCYGCGLNVHQVFKYDTGTNHVIDGRDSFGGNNIDSTESLSLFAGVYSIDLLGDEQPAVEASLEEPYGMASDSSGNLYIADSAHQRVRMIEAGTGIIHTVAGDGQYGYSGDGGPATSAEFRNPLYVTVDSSGNLYISDNGNSRVRKVTPGADGVVNGSSDETITTYAGNGTPAYSGDGGAATSASIRFQRGIDMDATGNLYIADSNNYRIRKVAPDGTITTVAGDGAYCSDTSCGDGGPALKAQVAPTDIAAGDNGTFYFGDYHHKVRKVDSNGLVTDYAGNGSFCYYPGDCGDGGLAVDAQITSPYGLDLDEVGNVYVTDWLGNRVRKIDPRTNLISTVAGTGVYGDTGDGGPATDARTRSNDVEVDVFGNIFITDTVNDHVRIIAHGICGNSIEEANESCDDGNTTSGDGCSNVCKLEYQTITGNACIDSSCQVLQGCFKDDFGLYNQGMYVACVAHAAKDLCNLSGNALSDAVVKAAQSSVNAPGNTCGQ